MELSGASSRIYTERNKKGLAKGEGKEGGNIKRSPGGRDVCQRWMGEERLECISLCKSPAGLICHIFSKYSQAFAKLLESDARNVGMAQLHPGNI